MKNNQDLKRSLFILLILILAANFVLFLVNGFFVWQLFLAPPPQTPTPIVDVDAAVQGTQQAFELTQTQLAALTLMAAPSETIQPTPEISATPEEVTATPTETPTLTPTQNQESLLDDGYYTVRPGDTLQSIAAVFGIADTALRTANQMAGDTILTGQKIFVPEPDAGTSWAYDFSDLPKPQLFSQRYIPPNDPAPRITLYVNPAQYPANAEAELFSLHLDALSSVESWYQELSPGSFDLYVAGTLFEQDHLIRSASYADAGMVFIVFDGSGTPTELFRLATYETARFYGERVLGTADSPLLKEGAAMYIAQEKAALIDTSVPSLRRYCIAYLNDGILPTLSDSDLRWESESGDMVNFHTAGCFYDFLYQQTSIDVMKQLYSSGNYEALLGRTLAELNDEFQTWLMEVPEQQHLQPVGFAQMVLDLAEEYRSFMPDFDGSAAHLEIYSALDQARTHLLLFSMTEAQVQLTRARQLIANQQ